MTADRSSQSETADPPFVLPREMREQIVAHARRDAPRECCGVIGGRAGRVETLYPLTNLDRGTDFYRIDDVELFQVYQRIDAGGGEIVAIYHSHPVSPAYPSPTDVRLAAWPDAHYLICSLADPEQPVLRAFRIVDGAIREVALAD
ncbi:MAG TPA: M67 family metallopeptidase [Thermomicrobiales bacterium]|jgi:proteasome lid subunit RPN8/RPN11|nr:M67 family metallopeptidase [Thermomicrobiales bacterium]